MVVSDPMPGVRAGLVWILASASGIAVVAEAPTVAGTLAAPGDVVLAGLRFPDGTAADVIAGPRPVVVHTWLPADERADVDLTGAAAVCLAGSLRAALAPAIRAAALQFPGSVAST